MNVILIILDSLRSDCVGGAGRIHAATPNMDRFAQSAIRFTRAFCDTPDTVSSRWTLLTGKYAFARSRRTPIPPQIRTLPAVLRAHGVRSACMGDTPSLFDHGFGLSRDFDTRTYIPGQMSSHLKTGNPVFALPDRIMQMNGANPDEVRQWLTYLAATDIRDVSKRPPAKVIQQAVAWLQRMKDKRFFLWLDFFAAHEPWDPPKSFLHEIDRDYDGIPIPLPRYPHASSYTREQIRHIRNRYRAKMQLIDTYFGRLWDDITQQGIHENTAVLLISDHGVPLGEHGTIRRSTPCMFDELLRTVCLMHLPEGLGRAKEVDAIIQTVDLVPTVYSLLGVPAPGDLDGRDLMPLVRGDQKCIRREAVFGHCMGTWDAPAIGMTTDRWHLIHYAGETAVELYDREKDPGLLTECADAQPDRTRALRQSLRRFVMAYADPDAALHADFPFLLDKEDAGG